MAESQIELLNRREIEGAGRLAGYRNIWHASRLRHHVHVPRSLVAKVVVVVAKYRKSIIARHCIINC